MEIAKRDASIATFFIVQNGLGATVIDLLGSKEQKDKWLDEVVKLKKILAFGLTEPNFGSDASNLQSTAQKVEGGYILNG